MPGCPSLQTKEKALREEMAANKEKEAKEDAKSNKGTAQSKKVGKGLLS